MRFLIPSLSCLFVISSFTIEQGYSAELADWFSAVNPDSAGCEEQNRGVNFSHSLEFEEDLGGEHRSWGSGTTFGYRLREDVTYSGKLTGTITGALVGTAQDWNATLNTSGQGQIQATLKVTGVRTRGKGKKARTETKSFGIATVIATFKLSDRNDIHGSCDQSDDYSINVEAPMPKVVLTNIRVQTKYTGPFPLFASKTAKERMATGLINHIQKRVSDAQSRLGAQKNALIEFLKPKVAMVCYCFDVLTDPPEPKTQSGSDGAAHSTTTQLSDPQPPISCLNEGYTWIRNNPASSGICHNPSSGLCYPYAAGDVQYANGSQECS
ncbi:MAG: hypothetical protein RIS36_1658 [Pseudomonadota bacterium]|jgi:hypothetical protein